MVVPDWDPRELLVARDQVQVSPVRRQALAVVVEGVDLIEGKRDTAIRVTPSIITVGILVDVVSEVDYIVYRVFPDGIPVGVEEAEG